MKCFQRLLFVFFIALFFSCKPVAIALLCPLGKYGISGEVKFVQEKNGKVFMSAFVSGSGRGTRAMHIHEKGDCSAADGISSGGHWNSTTSPPPMENGGVGSFIMVILATSISTRRVKVFYALVTDRWCIKCNDPEKIL